MTKADIIKWLCEQQFPELKSYWPLYQIYRSTGELELPPSLGNIASFSRLTAEGREQRKAFFDQVEEFEEALTKRPVEQVRELERVELLLDALCKFTIERYSDTVPGAVARAMLATHGVPKPGALPSAPPPLLPDEAAAIRRKAEEVKNGWRGRPLAEIEKAHDEARREHWGRDKVSLEAAAKTIAERIFPEDGLEWTADDRRACQQSYVESIRQFVLRGRVPLHNPFNQQRISADRLSDERFPANGLIAIPDLYLALRQEHAGRGYFPEPARAQSMAPPPITPLHTSAPIRLRVSRPDWSTIKAGDSFQLWELACLATDIEPRTLSYGRRPICKLNHLQALPQPVIDLWGVISRASEFAMLPKHPESGLMLHSGMVKTFAKWALERGLMIPEQMIALAATEAESNAGADPNEATTMAPPFGTFIDTEDTSKPRDAAQKEKDLVRELADIVAEIIRQPDRSATTLNGVTREMELLARSPNRARERGIDWAKFAPILRGQKGAHGRSWFIAHGLKGWLDPKYRK